MTTTLQQLDELVQAVERMRDCINSLSGPLPCRPNTEWQEYVKNIALEALAKAKGEI